MIQHGKKVDKTRKYTLQEARQILKREKVDSVTKKMLTPLLQLAIMAHIDCRGESGEVFKETFERYAIDYYNGEFTLSAMRKYNTENLSEIFAGQADKEIYGA